MAYNKPTKNSPPKGVTISHQTAIQVKNQLLPDHQDLAQYEKIIPGVGDRLLTMSEKEQNHRHSIERKGHYRILTGQFFALLSILIIGAVCAYGMYLGFANQSATIATGTLVVIVLAFLGLKNKSAQKHIEQN